MVNRLLGGAIVAVALLPVAQGFADGPGDNLPGSVRPIPPPGIELDEATQRRLLDGAAALARDVAAIAGDSDADPAEVLVFARAVRLAVEDRFLYSEKDVEQAERLLDRGRERLGSLRAGTTGPRLVLSGSPQASGPRLAVGGFRSRIDGSVQPYGLVLPADVDPADARPRRLDVWLHGRDEKVSEATFLTRRLAMVGECAPPDTIVLHPYGRYSNAFKFAGETDVLEAIEHVKTLFPIDDTRIVIRGFSMGGAGCWQFAVHFPGGWLAATPGAGFAETREFLRTFQQQAFEPTAAQARLLHWYDCPDWANNLRHLPSIAYSGELDRQKQAADVMVAAAAARGFEIPHVIGPQTAHKLHSESKVEIEAFVARAAEQGRPVAPREIDFTTYTLRYPTHTWLTINGLGEHWREARVRAAVRSSRTIEITTTNVTALALDILADAEFVDASDTVAVRIDGAVLPGLPVKHGGEAWSIGTARSAVGSSLPVLVYPNPLNPERYVVWNSGFTYREYAYLNNARQIPMLPDWALVSTVEGRDSQFPGTILAEGFFDERWQP
jgi:hypothetical protein